MHPTVQEESLCRVKQRESERERQERAVARETSESSQASESQLVLPGERKPTEPVHKQSAAVLLRLSTNQSQECPVPGSQTGKTACCK